MKKVLSLLVIILCGIFLWQKDIVTKFVAQKIIYKDSVVVGNANEYYKNDDFLLVQNADKFIIKEKSQILNIIYTIINNGWEDFTFFCDYTYKTCSDDFYNIVENSDYVQVINNYVNPFNSYSTINFSIDSFGKINIKFNKSYTEKQIDEINYKINNFISNNITTTMNDKQKIRLFHDFIIEKSAYDQNFNINMNKEKYSYHPYNAYGPLIENLGICSGYSDAMAIFLDKIGVKNYRISNKEHIWNAVYLDSNWYHLDLTWDDPVTSNGQQVILYDFYLITTDALRKKATSQHEFNNNFYLEIK